MNDDMREIFGKALPETEPPVAFSSDSLLETGKRKRRHRAIGAFTGGVAVVAALAVSLPMAIGDGVEVSQAAHGGQLPELDSDGLYGWLEGEAEASPASEEYGDAFWGWLEANAPGFEYIPDKYLENNGVDTSKPPTFDRDEITLMRYADAEDPASESVTTGLIRPVYHLADSFPWDKPNTWSNPGPPMVQMPGVDNLDIFDAAVYPAGTYTDGTKGPLPQAPAKGDENFFDLINCEGGETDNDTSILYYDLGIDVPIFYDIECRETQTADGMRVVEVGETVTDKAGNLVSKANALVLYRFDGSAVVLRNLVPGREGPSRNVADMEPALGFEELTDLAASLPDDAVE